ncbi:hypothetical protein ACFWYW_11050 [Nonomuraea sp. NPDC059023]|uniref:hypothetical protein n=1 Tax=unclassified Nonomuraea TaxID=2593643 RepID=UPI003674D37A
MSEMSRLRVPYITAYDDEYAERRFTLIPDASATDGRRLGFVGAAEQDWMFGVLWHRPGLHRRGRPEWKMVNTLRQRRCMLRLLCQVCGGPATTQGDCRISWLLADPPETISTGKPFTNAPPTCRGCIPEALTACPRLRRAACVYTTRSAEPYGVVGDTVRPSAQGLVKVAWDLHIPLDSFRLLEYAVAKQLLVTMDDLQPNSPFGYGGSKPGARSR